ncbi:zinc transporter ZIP3-like [Toxorhynchites rutilus septentrionalis]|uniref:zinc transporter ZIP3-like n=1 Tax=Toxorhynchites rutilus septentrionalis TaxID=329112 RepID=UPI0024799748|nr:zinc transporter ZIP3-like [Toxorhynchites rutilus septentrionalis]
MPITNSDNTPPYAFDFAIDMLISRISNCFLCRGPTVHSQPHTRVIVAMDWRPSTSFTIIGSKLLAILVLGVGSFVSGIFPLYLSNGKSGNRSRVVSALLCFGAGVLLATALVHILPDVRESLPNYAELVFCAGYFLIYAVDELLDLHVASVDSQQQRFCDADLISLEVSKCNHNGSTGMSSELSLTPTDVTQPAPRTVGLLLALCVHSLLEGLAIGVQSSPAKVLLLLAAVSAHKFVVAFCLGLEIYNHGKGDRCRSSIQILFFSLGSVGGIGVGMMLDGLDEDFNGIAVPALQAIAGGTLLYVTVSEIIPRERGKRQFDNAYGIMQLAAVICGFAVMASLSVFIK